MPNMPRNFLYVNHTVDKDGTVRWRSRHVRAMSQALAIEFGRRAFNRGQDVTTLPPGQSDNAFEVNSK